MQNELENFDQLLKNAYDGYEAPLNDLHWEELEEELKIVTPGMTGYFSAITTGLVATSMVFMAMLFFVSDANYGPQHVEDEVLSQDITTGNGHGVDLEKLQSINDNTELDSNEIASTENLANENDNTVSTTEQAEEVEAIDTIIEEETSINHSETTSPEPTIDDNTVVASSVESEERSNIRTGCTGLTIDFDAAEEYGTNAKYLWNFGDGFFSNEATPSHTFNKEGVFDVSLSVTSAASGQITSNVVQAMIEVVEAPIANIDVTIESANTITLNNKSYNANDVEWKVDGSTEGNGASISLSVADNTNYELKLAALNEGGCVDTLSTEVRSINAGSEFPRAFETAYGHKFAPGAILDEGEVTSIKIFNKKTGALVFEGSGNKGWTGDLPSGDKAERGTYQWMMSVEQDVSIDIYHGNLELR